MNKHRITPGEKALKASWNSRKWPQALDPATRDELARRIAQRPAPVRSGAGEPLIEWTPAVGRFAWASSLLAAASLAYGYASISSLNLWASFLACYPLA